MSHLPALGLRQPRGQWIATPADARSTQILGVETCAVLRDFRDGKWSWRGTPTLTDEALTSGAGAWWMLPRHEVWRSLLKPGSAVALRWATNATPDAPSGSVGAWIGLFRLGSIMLAPHRIHLTLTDRIAEIPQ
jgi:hypothetical protein